MRGGHREGAGRKKGFAAKQAELAPEVLAAMVIAEIEPIGKALIEAAKKGSVPAAKELFDRAFGKPPMEFVKELYYKHGDRPE